MPQVILGWISNSNKKTNSNNNNNKNNNNKNNNNRTITYTISFSRDAIHKEDNYFAGTAKCKSTTMCEPLPGYGFARGGYK